MKYYFVIISKLRLQRVVNYFKLCFSFTISKLTKNNHYFGRPAFLSIEPTNFCNLKCPECPTGNDNLNRPKGKMDFDTFKKIIDETYKDLIYLNLYFQGEPLMNDEIYKFIKYADDKNIITELSTNGHFIDEHSAEKIINSGLNNIIISLDGDNQSVYEKYRIGGDFEKVLSGIKVLSEKKKKLNKKFPIIKTQLLVFSHNEKRIKQTAIIAKETGADIFLVKTAQFYDLTFNNTLIPENNKYLRYILTPEGKYKPKSGKKHGCFKMWSSCVVTWDGKLVPCCYDKDAKNQLGNIKNEDLIKLWNSNEYNELRQKVIKSRSNLTLCADCNEK